MTKVHCTVSDCEYWGDNNYCVADEILITAPPIQPHSENVNHHGKGTENAPHTPVEREDGSYCYTFEKEE